MYQQMLSVVADDPIKQAELKTLFGGHPIVGEWHGDQFEGVTDGDGNIWMRPGLRPARLLAIYLHEVTHAQLFHAGHPRWYQHGEDFVKLCRILQTRYGVEGESWHDYDQQDAVVKTTARQANIVAHAAARAIEFDPAQHALRATVNMVQAEKRHSLRYVLIVGGLALLSMIAVTQPIGQWWDAAMDMLSGDAVKLIGGGALVAWMWWSLRG